MLLLNILTYHLAETIPQKILKIHKIYLEHNLNFIHKIVSTTIAILQNLHIPNHNYTRGNEPACVS